MWSECTDPTHRSKDGPWLALANPHTDQSDWVARGWAGIPAETLACSKIFTGASEKSAFSLPFLEGLPWGHEVWNSSHTYCCERRASGAGRGRWGGLGRGGGRLGEVNNCRWGVPGWSQTMRGQARTWRESRSLVNQFRHWIKPHRRPALTSGFAVAWAKRSLLCLSQSRFTQTRPRIPADTEGHWWPQGKQFQPTGKHSKCEGFLLEEMWMKERRVDAPRKGWGVGKRPCFVIVIVVHCLFAGLLVLRCEIPESNLKINCTDLEQGWELKVQKVEWRTS